MNFIDLQGTVKALIASHPIIAPDAASVVFLDVGDKRPAMDAQLDISSTPAGKGYAIAVWPPAQGSSDQEKSGASGTESMVIVRLEANPKMLLALNVAQNDPDAASKWLNLRIQAIISSVIQADEEAGGVRFQLAENAFELANFDEGLVSYHIRFKRFAVFEYDDDTVLPLPPALVPPTRFQMTDSVSGAIVTITVVDGQLVLDYP